MKIVIPASSLVVLIGISGSGKSTFARERFAATEIISSDHCRALVCDDENDQSVNQEAFAILHLITASRLAHRKLTVIDATNVKPEARAQLLKMARKFRVRPIAMVFNFDAEICLQHNANRVHRVVPRDVILQQHHELQHSLRTLDQEGFHAIHIYTSPAEIAAISLQRKNSRSR